MPEGKGLLQLHSGHFQTLGMQLHGRKIGLKIDLKITPCMIYNDWKNDSTSPPRPLSESHVEVFFVADGFFGLFVLS